MALFKKIKYNIDEHNTLASSPEHKYEMEQKVKQYLFKILRFCVTISF